MTEHCEFGDTLEDMLRDRLVCGICNDSMQRRLLAEPKLTFKKAYELATAMESAARDAQDLHRTSSQPHSSVHAVRPACRGYRFGNFQATSASMLSLRWKA